MKCQPSFFYSEKIAERRQQQAKQRLGESVVYRLLVFAFYLLGARREEIAEFFGFTLASVKAIVARLISHGILALDDRRRSHPGVPPPVPPPVVEDSTIKVEKEGSKIVLSGYFEIPLPSNKDRLSRKIFVLNLFNADIISRAEAATLLNCSPEAISLNIKKFREGGAIALMDQRRGQSYDYKFTSNVRGEMVYSCSMIAIEGERISSITISEHLQKAGYQDLSQRGIRKHMTEIGIVAIKDRLREDVKVAVNDRVKKNQPIR